jgi:hypothetical protein
LRAVKQPTARAGSFCDLDGMDLAPVPLAGAGITLALFARGFLRLRRRGGAGYVDRWRVALIVLALALATLPLVSPLDQAGDDYLLSAHMLQHVLLGDAAPALALVALRGPLLFCLRPGSDLGARCAGRFRPQPSLDDLNRPAVRPSFERRPRTSRCRDGHGEIRFR